MMPGVSAFGTGGLVRPEDLALGVADRNDVLAVGRAGQDQSFRTGRAADGPSHEDHGGAAYPLTCFHDFPPGVRLDGKVWPSIMIDTTPRRFTTMFRAV